MINNIETIITGLSLTKAPAALSFMGFTSMYGVICWLIITMGAGIITMGVYRAVKTDMQKGYYTMVVGLATIITTFAVHGVIRFALGWV